jgi:hypothetical protein
MKPHLILLSSIGVDPAGQAAKSCTSMEGQKEADDAILGMKNKLKTTIPTRWFDG